MHYVQAHQNQGRQSYEFEKNLQRFFSSMLI